MPLAAVIGVSSVLGAVSSRNASKRAVKSQDKARESAVTETNKSTAQARQDLFNLFPAAEQRAQQGFQGALDVFGQALPAQAQVFQQGNVAAQQQLLSGLPQFQNAILGGNVDFSQLQPTQLQQPDLSFFQQQLPQQLPQGAGSPPQFDQLFHPQRTDLGNPLAGIFGGQPNRFGMPNKFGLQGNSFVTPS